MSRIALFARAVMPYSYSFLCGHLNVFSLTATLVCSFSNRIPIISFSVLFIVICVPFFFVFRHATSSANRRRKSDGLPFCSDSFFHFLFFRRVFAAHVERRRSEMIYAHTPGPSVSLFPFLFDRSATEPFRLHARTLQTINATIVVFDLAETRNIFRTCYTLSVAGGLFSKKATTIGIRISAIPVAFARKTDSLARDADAAAAPTATRTIEF